MDRVLWEKGGPRPGGTRRGAPGARPAPRPSAPRRKAEGCRSRRSQRRGACRPRRRGWPGLGPAAARDLWATWHPAPPVSLVTHVTHVAHPAHSTAVGGSIPPRLTEAPRAGQPVRGGLCPAAVRIPAPIRPTPRPVLKGLNVVTRNFFAGAFSKANTGLHSRGAHRERDGESGLPSLAINLRGKKLHRGCPPMGPVRT